VYFWKKFSQAAHCLSGAVFGQEKWANLGYFQGNYSQFLLYFWDIGIYLRFLGWFWLSLFILPSIL